MTSPQTAWRDTADALVVGTPFVDMVFGGLPDWPAPGEEQWAERRTLCAGGVANNATVLSRLGRRTALAGVIGTDEIGDLLLTLLRREESLRLDRLVRRPGFVTPFTLALGDGNDRSFLTQGDHSAHQIDGEPPRARSCFLSLSLEPAAWLPGLREAGCRVFAGVGFDERLGWDSAVLAQLDQVDVLVCNEREALAYTRCDDLRQALRRLADLVPLVVVTLGERGSLACQQDVGEFSAAAVPAAAVDTTGAGDAFVSALMDAFLRDDATLDQALRHAALVSSLVVGGLGGSASAPRPAQLRRRAAELGPDFDFEFSWFPPADPDPTCSQ